MAHVFRKFTKRFFIIANIITVAVFLLACANTFLHPNEWWVIAVLGLAFPFILILVILFLFFWLIFRSKWFFLSLIALVIGYTNIRALIGFNFNNNYSKKKDSTAIRVLTWNVTWFDEQTKRTKNTKRYRKDMLKFIGEQQPDVICLQEYLEPNMPGYYSNRNDISQLGYPYHFIVSDYERANKTFQVGVAIFSRYPLLDSFHVIYPGSKLTRAAESLIAIDIKLNGKPIRIFTTHLQSVLLQKDDYRNLEIIKNADDSIMEASKSLLKKLKQGYTFRSDQVDTVRKELDASPYPEIICGDFNDIPNSYSYFRIRHDRLDAFVEKSSGIGRTFSHISPTLRIDYILADKQFEVLQYKRFVLPYSEHYPLIADLRFKENN